MTQARIRSMTSDDAARAWQVAYESLQVAGRAYGWDMPDLDDAARERGTRRVLHSVVHDPDGAFVAELAGEIVGAGIATRRGSLWFLSLLTVDTRVQAQGIGRRLLDATLRTLRSAGSICASDDPKALRRYRAAGFDLQPCYEAKGPLDRSLLPPVTGVEAASYDDRREFVEDVARQQRHAPHGPDLDFFAAADRPLFVTDTAAGRGYVVCADDGPAVLGATSAAAAQALLWTAITESTKAECEIGWVRQDQQWAIDVALAARLRLRPTGSFCVRGAVGPMSPYLPNASS